jgi:hypothetical protein
MGGSGGGSGSGKTTIRYASYIEDKHEDFLDTVANYRADLTDESPFADYEDVEVDDAFFGAGYTISNYASLFETYGDYMLGVDIDALWTSVFADTVNSPEVDAVIDAEMALMDDDIETNTIPRMQLGMRDINSVLGSSFVVGKAIIEDARAKALAKFDAEIRYKLIPIAESRWRSQLQWNQQVVTVYAELMKLYYAVKTDVNEANYSFAAKDKLWPFTVLDFERAALGALQGAINEKRDVAGSSTAAKTISGALSGAALGAQVSGGNPYATGAGAVIGGLAGAFSK